MGYPGVSFLQENTDSEAKHQHEDEADRAEPADHAMRVDLARCTIGALERGVALRRARIEGLGHGARVATGGVVHRALCVFITLPEASACTSGTVPFRSLPARFLRAPDPSASPAATAGLVL